MSAWTEIRGQFRDARAAYAARRQLERELAGYSTESDLNDLHAMLDRYPDRDTVGIRRILASQRATA
jgi:hypothetical protein